MKSYDIKLLMYLILVSFVCSSPRRTTFMMWQKYIHVVTYKARSIKEKEQILVR
jgi:hypothetical protein